MTQVIIVASDVLLHGAAQLRSACFHGPVGTGTDSFDERSVHITFSRAGSTIAYARLTRGAPGLFNAWSKGKADLPAGPDIADLGRCCVHPDFRGQRLFSAVCLAACAWARASGCSRVNGSYISGATAGRALHEVGFRDHGSCVKHFEPNGNVLVVQPITLSLPEVGSSQGETWRECVEAARGGAVALPSELLFDGVKGVYGRC